MVPAGSGLPDEIEMPVPRNPRENQQEQFLRDFELKPVDYYPPDVYRDMVQTWPGVKMNPREMLAARGIEVDPEWVKS
jgi:hypothetical protein